jgi:hypothetical protein
MGKRHSGPSAEYRYEHYDPWRAALISLHRQPVARARSYICLSSPTCRDAILYH